MVGDDQNREQAPPFSIEILFQSAELLVRRVARGVGGICYVTFDSYTDFRSLDRPGFGQDFFQSRGIDAVHVLSRDNYWYQHPELPDALAAVRRATCAYDRVFAYGSSMGGFAALHYGADCGATCGIAISPQFSVDPRVAPFEDRWLSDAMRIVYRRDADNPLPQQYIFYDPKNHQDAAHFSLFESRSPTIGLRVPYAGHPVGSYLHETDSFTPFFEGLHSETLDARGLERRMRARRNRSGQYFLALSRRIPSWRPQQRVAIARRAAELEPCNAIYASNLGSHLDALGKFGEAELHHKRAIELSPNSFHVLNPWALHLQKKGELAEAVRVAERIILDFPDVSSLRWRFRILFRMERRRHLHGKVLQILFLEGLFDLFSKFMRDGWRIHRTTRLFRGWKRI